MSMQFLLLSWKFFLSANEGFTDGTSFSPLLLFLMEPPEQEKVTFGKQHAGSNRQVRISSQTTSPTVGSLRSVILHTLQELSAQPLMTPLWPQARILPHLSICKILLFFPSLFSNLLLKLHSPCSRFLPALYKQLFRHCCYTVYAYWNENERAVRKQKWHRDKEK